LLPGLYKLDGVDPFVVSRTANVVEVVVDTSTTCAVHLARSRNTDQVARIVVRPQKRDVIRNFHTTLIVGQHFLHTVSDSDKEIHPEGSSYLVKYPSLWDIRCGIGIEVAEQKGLLRCDDVLKIRSL